MNILLTYLMELFIVHSPLLSDHKHNSQTELLNDYQEN